MANVEEIMASLKEYTKEDINDPETIKTQISELLKTHRPIKLADYQYGFSCKGTKNHRLIVKEENDKTKVREYMKQKNIWACTSRGSSRQHCLAGSIKMYYGILFAPLNHSDKCDTKDHIFVLKIQGLIEEGKFSEAHGLVVNVKKSNHNASNQSLSTSMLDESHVSTTDFDSFLDQSVANDTTASIDSIIVPTKTPTRASSGSVPQAAGRLNRKRRSDVENGIRNVQPAPKKSNIDDPILLNHPSTFSLQSFCTKLKIQYNHKAYKFWGDIEFQEIVPVSENIRTHSFKSQNIFACLSQFFTGTNDSCFFLQYVINTAFRDELIASGEMSRADIDDIFNKVTVSDQHIEFIAKFLSCRIGIFENGSLKKYGKWETENSCALTLILSIENGFYSVVLDL